MKPAITWAGLVDVVRSSIWCSVPANVAILVLGCLFLALYGETLVGMLAAFGLLLIGLMMIGIRLLILQYSEDPRAPSNCCRKCGYNLTGNVSNICPECGEKI
jgi:hypothetical protein